MAVYAEMKDSGIPWVGLVPKEWDVRPAGTVFYEEKEKNRDNVYSKPYSFRYGEIVDKKIIGEIDEALEETISAYRIVHTNTIMINGLNLNYDFVSQRVAIVRKTGIITSAYLAVAPIASRIDPFYAMYLFKGYDSKQVFHGIGNGIRKTLKFKDFRYIPIPLPAMNIQRSIATFLDGKCQTIAEIQNDAKESIESYKQLKASLIFEAVTKGLNPCSEMKDSGSQWTGRIPKHWEIRRLKMSVDLIRQQASAFNNYIGLENVESGSARLIQGEGVKEDFSGQALAFCKDDVLFGKLRPYLAKVFQAQESGCCSGEFLVMRTRTVCSRFLKYFVLSHSFVDAVNQSTYGTKMPRANWDFIGNLNLLIPPSTEAEEIANYLDDRCAKIDALIAEKEVLIKDLEAYKKSLIFECVTGKRKVC